MLNLIKKFWFVVIRKGIHSRSDTNRTGAESLSFYYPRLLYCTDQMLAVMLLSQHRLSSSKAVRPYAPCSARCMGHAIRPYGLQFVQRRRTRILVKERDPVCTWTNGITLPNTSLQAIRLDPRYSGQAHSNTPGFGPGYENTGL